MICPACKSESLMIRERLHQKQPAEYGSISAFGMIVCNANHLNARFQPRPEAAAQRSNYLDCQGDLCMLCVRHLLHVPGRMMFDHGVQDRS
jgi:hypothetical protein